MIEPRLFGRYYPVEVFLGLGAYLVALVYRLFVFQLAGQFFILDEETFIFSPKFLQLVMQHCLRQSLHLRTRG
jgi:hypothetical protein